MNIILYKNNSDPREVPKNITDAITKTGSIKDASSITTPAILVASFDVSYNYCYISEFNRYYYITDIAVVRSGLYEVKCKCDVLQSFYDEFKTSPMTANRSSSSFNAYIPDSKRCFYQYSNNQYIRLGGELGTGIIGKPSVPILVTCG